MPAHSRVPARFRALEQSRATSRFRATVAVGAALLAVACDGGRAGEVAVYHTADSYGYFDDCGCRSDSTGGLAKRAWVVDSLRRDGAPFLLVDAGNFSGGPNVYGAALGRVTIDAMELMGYDALTLGDWDINLGPAYLREVLADSPIAWVHTNYDIVGLEGLGHETLVIERGGRRIGLIGLFNPTILLNGALRDSVVVEDIVESASAAVAALREQDVDAVVALSHLSYKANRALAEHVDGIDLIVSGHGGKSLIDAEQAAPETWIVAAGDLGRFLGNAELRFADEGNVTAVESITGDLMVMEPALPDDPRLQPLFARHEAWRREQRQTDLQAAQRSAPPAADLQRTQSP